MKITHLWGAVKSYVRLRPHAVGSLWPLSRVLAFGGHGRRGLRKQDTFLSTVQSLAHGGGQFVAQNRFFDKGPDARGQGFFYVFDLTLNLRISCVDHRASIGSRIAPMRRV